MLDEKQIEKMSEDIASMLCEAYRPDCDEYQPHTCSKCYVNSTPIGCFAEMLYNAGYRKQSGGEWIFEFTLDGDDFYKCSVCGRQEVINGLCKERNPVEHYPYCHCGAKMKGGAE
jgi:hypothetical protein